MIHRNKKIHRVFIFISWAGILSAIALIILIGFWLFMPYKIAEVKQPFEVLNKHNTVNINDKLLLKIEVVKYIDAEPTTYPSIRCESGNLVTLAQANNNTLPKGSYKFISDRITLPPKFAVGDRCQFVSTQIYRVNPIRTITYEFFSEFFTIGEPI
jgi:hypothetical protein